MSDGEPGRILVADEWTVNVECPHCDRGEDFGDEWTAKAWMYRHIYEAHADELPPIEL